MTELASPTLEDVLEGLRWLQRDWFDGDEHEEYDPVWRKLADAITFLENQRTKTRRAGGGIEHALDKDSM